MSFFVKACIVALKEIPAVNAEIDGDDIVYKNYYDIGVAVGAEQGLVVPVVRDADQLSFAEIEKKVADLGRRARDGKLSLDELSGGTFTITNGGVYGSLLSTPILNPPQTGILGMHKIQHRPVAIGDKIEIRPMMYLALTYDHRLIDGREAVTFLVRVKECIEEPQRLLFDDVMRDGRQLRHHRHRRRAGRLCRRDPRGAARHERRLRREARDARRHLPQCRLHPVEGAAAILGEIRGSQVTRSPSTASPSARSSSISRR